MLTFELPIQITREELLELTAVFADMEGTLLLYSGGDFDSAACSYLFLFPFESIEIKNEDNPWEILKSKMVFSEGYPINPSWVGFLSYEISDPDFSLPKIVPDAYFQRSAFILKLEHKTSKATVFIESTDLKEPARTWLTKFSKVDFWKSFIEELREIKSETYLPLKVDKDFETLGSYTLKIEEIKEMIKDGSVYQVNLSHECMLSGHRNPYHYFCQLMTKNPAPFSAYFKNQKFTIVSSSPERFLKKNDDILETRPIKGTIARGKTASLDLKNQLKLQKSKKDFSELLMITDLMRNDLGKISLAGSVKVIKIAQLEAYANVFHLLSIIESKPFAKMHSVDIIKNCFPGGSITGCPKLPAMKAIKKFEKRTRGIYTGSIGYFNSNGDFDFNIAIRTLLFFQDKIQVQLGGAITIDSRADSEYLETMQKGESIFQSLT